MTSREPVSFNPPDSETGLDPLDLIRESVIGCDGSGRITSWNRAAQSIYGWPAHAALGQDIDDLLATDGSREGVVVRRHRDGHEVLVDLRLTTQRGPSGAVLCTIETGQDVTAMHAAEDSRLYSDQRYHSLFRAVAASFWELDTSVVNDMVVELVRTGVSDLAGYFVDHPAYVRKLMQATRILDVNQQTADLFGNGKKAEFVGSIDFFWPDESLPAYSQALLADIADQSSFITEARFRKLNGDLFDGLFTCAFPPPRSGHRTIMVGVIDLTDRKRAYAEMERSERRYKGLFRHTPVALCQLDESALVPIYDAFARDGITDLEPLFEADPNLLTHLLDLLRVADANEYALTLLGAASLDDLQGPVTPFWEKGRATVRRAFAARYAGQASFQEETRLVTRDGRIIDVLFGANYQKGEDQQRQIILSFVDIGERIKAQDTLSRVQADFAHAARISMLGELTASIAHEVNQPLGAIVANGQAGQRWLSREVPNVEQALKSTLNMVADARRASDIIGRIRAMAINRAPKRELLLVNDMISDSMVFLAHEMQARDVEASLDLAPGLPACSLDPTQIQQVLVNLCINAIQAMTQHGSPKRLLRVGTGRNEAGDICCTVEDSGLGIAPDHIEHLFDSFFTTKDTGMGMGLPICRSIIEAHGGTLAVDNQSRLGGARFTFTIPAV